MVRKQYCCHLEKINTDKRRFKGYKKKGKKEKGGESFSYPESLLIPLAYEVARDAQLDVVIETVPCYNMGKLC